ncbi:MAG: hypothetical protein KAX49_06740 [Halanaerobiales bacterium]|nr:hypothetical protein [Halanaerobiales bacterium]
MKSKKSKSQFDVKPVGICMMATCEAGCYSSCGFNCTGTCTTGCSGGCTGLCADTCSAGIGPMAM